MVFHMPQKQVNITKINIENIEVECADEFNFLGLIIHKHLKWDSHITKVVVVNHCFTSLFGTKGLLSDIIIR